jgi:hypothetical protein
VRTTHGHDLLDLYRSTAFVVVVELTSWISS